MVGIICIRFAFQICPIDKIHQHSQGIENFSLYCIGARNLMRFFTFFVFVIGELHTSDRRFYLLSGACACINAEGDTYMPYI